MNAMLGDLPTWNLSDLYSSPGGPDLDADLKRAAADADPSPRPTRARWRAWTERRWVARLPDSRR